MKVFFDALGCPKALVDAERMCFFLEKDHHILVSDPLDADAVIINTCGFIEKAKRENIDAILQYVEMKKEKPSLKIVISGCLSERYKKDLLKEIPEIDSAIGVRDLKKITEALETSSKDLLDTGDYSDSEFETERKLVFSGLHYAYLKIAEGCDRSCAFCAIPGIRGTHRSRPMDVILREAHFLQDNGIQELILVSEDTLSYGSDLYGKRMLPELLEKLSELSFPWIRVLYLYPDKEVFDIVRVMNQRPNIVNYIDIPFQHASPGILRAMKRSGSAEEYLGLLFRIRETNPEVRIRTSFIVGFPGETEGDFEILSDFIQKARFNRVGFFEYSREEGTSSYDMKGRVPVKIIRERISKLAAIQEKISSEELKKLVGRALLCINDGITELRNGREWRLLRSEYDAPEIDGNVLVSLDDKIPDDEVFVQILIEDLSGSHDLTGTVLEE